jgi:DnaJ-class molecular chaperone
MSDHDDTEARDDLCPHCGGQGQVFIDDEPKFCLPCEGTGQTPEPD